jgi:16S rRNA A1518/A1519 N6-dimethyltransferase RsmA/KsgA/DIM1 with predicted DNA glycosylase/AP lyase activity
LIPRNDFSALNPKAFLDFVSRCFRQKRKKIRNNLVGPYDRALVDSIPVTVKRAEQLSISEFIELFEKLASPSLPPVS